MEFTVFAKKRTMTDGKSFTSYLARLQRKDGSMQTVQVKFREECGAPKLEDCPMNVIIDKENANLVTKDYVDKQGNTSTSHTLWVSAWKQGAEYIDTSLDDFE